MTNNTDQVDLVAQILKERCLLNETKTANDKEEIFCKGVFDGLFCWPDTLAGVLAKQPCVNDYLKATTEDGFVTKQCTTNGTWFVPEHRTLPWTNLSGCGKFYVIVKEPTYYEKVDPIYEEWLPVIKDMAYFGYTLSIFTCFLALIIFINIKRLHCERNKLHIHLFISFIVRGLLFLLKDVLFVKGTALTYDTEYVNDEPTYHASWFCRAFISIRYYFILSNFTFMLMEGLYLHNLIFLNLFSESHSTKIYCYIGWGIPVIFTVVWSVLRAIYENTLCWTQHENIYISLFIHVPIGFSVVINFLLFLIIMKTLTVKLSFNSTFIQQRRAKYRKLLKSTLILIPLYGIPYVISLIFTFYVNDNPVLDLIWLFFDQSFSAFQGLFAAFLYCLFNCEVHTEVRRKYSALKDQNHKEFRRSRTISTNTQQLSFQLNDDPIENLKMFEYFEDNRTKKDIESCF